MKKDYMGSVVKPFKKAETEVTEVMDAKIREDFQAVKDSLDGSHIQQLYDQLLRRKKTCGISDELKQEIFRYFLERQISEMNFIRLRDKHTLKILKLTKIKLKDLQLDWRDILARFEASNEETQKVAGLYQFLSILRPYYDCNNLLDVFEWFKGRYNLASEMTWFYIEKFVNLTPKTERSRLEKFLVILNEYFEMGGIKDMHLWRWLIRIMKKSHELDMSKKLDVLNNQLLKKFLRIQNKEKGSTQVLSAKFVGSSFANLIGKKNPMSVTMIRMFFETFKNSFVAFMESKPNIKLLQIVLTTLKNRKIAEDKLRKRIMRIQQSVEEEPESESEEESEKEDESDESGVSNLVGNYVVISESDSEEEEEDESEKSNKELRLKKLRAKLSNELTQEILDTLRYNLSLYLEDIFFVQCKEACKALGSAFHLFPTLAEDAVEMIRKGVEIPELNVPVLMKTTKKVLESLLANADRMKLLGYVLDILEQIVKIRYIKDGWSTINLVVGCIPLLDEEDCAKLEEHHKEFFKSHYGMNHDQFYEKYSELVFESFKRFLSENEAKEKKRLLLQNPFNNLATNSYKFFEKRCITHAVQLYLETHSLYIHYYLELKQIPESLLEPFLHKTLPSCKSDNFERKLLELVLAARSVSFEQLRQLIETLCNSEVGTSDVHETVRNMLETWVHENVYFHCSYKALKSSLEHMLPHHPGRGEFHLANHHRQQLEDRMKELMGMWNDYYDYVSKFIDDIAKGSEQLSVANNPTDAIIRMHFKNFDIDYTARKELLWRVRILKIVVETFPYHKSLFTGSHLLKDLRFEEFSALKDISERSVKLLERLMEVALSKFPHDHKLISVLKSYAGGLVDCEEHEFYLYAMDLKDVKKLIKKNEDLGITDYYLLNMQVDLRINLLNQAITFGRDNKITQPLIKYILLLTFHPDETGIPVRDADLAPKLTQLLFQLLRVKIHEDADDNKKKKFLVRLADVLNEHIGQSKTVVKGEELVELITICMDMISAPQRTVREAFLSALKALIGKIEHTKIDPKILEDRVLEGVRTGNSKQKLIWSICLIAASHSGKQVDYHRFNHLFNDLLFEEDFLMRKAAIFMIGFVNRTLRIASRKVTKLTGLPPYAPKTLLEFEDSGYLRPEHIHEHLLRKNWLRKYRAYFDCEIVEKTHFIDSFEFLNSPEQCVKFLQAYHTDQISSQDEVAFMTKRGSVIKEITELSDILGWIIKKYRKSVKLSKHQLSFYERLYGERFFKYLFEVDFDTGYRFFKATKQFMRGCLARVDTLDNQLVVSNYLTMLLNAYQQVWRKQRNEQLEQFCRNALRELMEKSAGQFWTLFCKVALNSLEEIQFLTEFFESIPPTSPSYYRSIERLLLIHANRHDKLFGILKATFQAGNGLANPIVFKCIKALITFPDKHFMDKTEVSRCGIFNIDEMLKEGKLEMTSEHLSIRTNEEFQEWLAARLQQLISSEHIDLRKIGGSLLFDSLTAAAELHNSGNSMKLLRRLLGVTVGWMTSNREEFKTEQNRFQVCLASILSEIYTPEEFKGLLDHLVKLLVPQPQTIHYLSTFYKNPYNFIKQSEQDYQKFILRLLELMENPLLYKEVLLCISGLLYYRKFGRDSAKEPVAQKLLHSETEKEQRNQILEGIKVFTNNERHRSVLLMALLLADVHNLRLYEQELEYILSGQKQKDKVKLWAKLMVESRGKAQLIEDEHTKSLWNKIKSFSNPYFYHA